MNRATFHLIPITARYSARLALALSLLLAAAWTVQPVLAQDGGTTHTVQAGENLYRIGLQYGLSVEQLVTANAISDPTRIFSGQVLTIPVSGSTTQATVAEPTLHSAAVNPAPDTSAYHVVLAGETLTSIAQQYSMSWQDLMAANGLGDPSHILIGQKLLVPDTGTEPTEPAPQSVVPPEIPDQVSAIDPQPADDLGIITSDTYPTPDSADLQPVDPYDVPDQVLAINPQTEVEDLGIITPSGEPVAMVPAQSAAVNPAPAAQTLGTNQQANVAPAAAANTASGERAHTVQAGEHLASIAAQYGLSYPTLAMANNITNPNQIFAGQTLVIPAQDYAPGSYVPQSTAPPAAAAPTITNGKQIVVDLSDQRVYAYQDGQLLQNALVSTGTAAFPTVQGDYKVYLKYESQTMSGPGYNLPGVPYVLYFYKGYSLHGTYWHSNFGTPMSHGCVNMYTPDAQWLWNWAPIGTPVHVQW